MLARPPVRLHPLLVVAMIDILHISEAERVLSLPSPEADILVTASLV